MRSQTLVKILFLLLFAFSAAACQIEDSFDALGALETNTATQIAELSLNPSVKTVSIGRAIAFSAKNGTPPYIFSMASGNGTIDSGTGIFIAPQTDGISQIKVTDSIGNVTRATVIVNPALSIHPLTATLLSGTTASFTGSGGVLPYSFTLLAGVGTINASTGTYQAGGTAGSATVQLADTEGNTALTSLTVIPALAISPASQAVAVNGTIAFSATGGSTPYTFSLLTGSVGTLVGANYSSAAAGLAWVRATDAAGSTSDCLITVFSSLEISPNAANVFVSSVTQFTSSGGVAPFTYSIVSGGGSINGSTGAYTAPAAPATAVIRIADSASHTADATLTVVAALAISPTNKSIRVGQTFTVTATGGLAPLSYALSGDSVGSLSGTTYTASAPGSALIRVTDAMGNTSDCLITAYNTLAITPATANVSVDSATQLNAVGGVGPFSYSKVSGGGSIVAGTGVYTAPSTETTAVLRVTDSLNNTSDATLTVIAPLAISPAAKVVAVNNSFSVLASGGVAPYTYTLVSGSVGTLTTTSYASTASGTASIKATDSLGSSAYCFVTVNPALSLSPSTMVATISTTSSFTVSGGVGTKTYALSGPGTLNSGALTYTAPATTATPAASITATDTLGNTATINITIVTPLALSASNKYLPTSSSPYTFSATGGVPPYSYSTTAAGSMLTSTGVYTAPSAPTEGTVTVTDSIGTSSSTNLTVFKPGLIDETFGASGVKILEISQAAGKAKDSVRAAAVQTDGKYILAGSSGTNTTPSLIRLSLDGTLDTTFGTNGSVHPSVPSACLPAIHTTTITSIALQSNGKIVAMVFDSFCSDQKKYYLLRFNADGSTDLSFGVNGIYSSPVVGGTGNLSWIGAIAIQADDKILVAGASGQGYYNFHVVRHNADGSLDTTFNGTGRVSIPYGDGATSIVPYSVAIQPADQKIILVGSAFTNTTLGNDFFALRLNTNGTVDTSFNTTGSVRTNSSGGNDDVAYAVALQSDGKIVLAGNGGGTSNVMLARYTSAGALDTTFNTTGIQTTAFGSGSPTLYSIAIAPDDSTIVAAGSANTGANDMGVIKLTSSGALDTGFNLTGKLYIDLGGSATDTARGVTLLSTGKIVLSGFGTGSTTSAADAALVRLNTDGTFDTSFGTNGKSLVDMGSYGDCYMYASVMQPDGKLIGVGSASTGKFQHFLVFRINPTGELDPTFGTGGAVVTTISSGLAEQFNDVVLQSDGKIVAIGAVGSAMAFARYTSAGVLDTTFGTASSGTIQIASTGGGGGKALTLQADGKILGVGQTSANTALLLRLTTAGAMDATFGTSGKAVLDIPSSNADQFTMVKLLSDGKILAAGNTTPVGFSQTDYVLARFTSLGALDTTFATIGYTVLDNTSAAAAGAPNDYVYQIVPTSTGSYWLLGDSGNAYVGIGAARLTSSGAVDTSFGSNGFAYYYTYASKGNYGVKTLPNGSLLIAGTSVGSGAPSTFDFVVSCWKEDMSLVSSFGTGGKVTQDLNGLSGDTAYTIALDSLYRPIIGGYSENGDHISISLMRTWPCPYE